MICRRVNPLRVIHHEAWAFSTVALATQTEPVRTTGERWHSRLGNETNRTDTGSRSGKHMVIESIPIREKKSEKYRSSQVAVSPPIANAFSVVWICFSVSSKWLAARRKCVGFMVCLTDFRRSKVAFCLPKSTVVRSRGAWIGQVKWLRPANSNRKAAGALVRAAPNGDIWAPF